MPHPKNQVEHICQWCNAPFTEKASRGRTRFCSRECRQEYRASTKSHGTCPTCGKEFAYYIKYPQKYCSVSCGVTARNRTDQNPSLHRDISGEKNPMFGKPGLRGSDNFMFGKTREQAPTWKGGRKVRRDGYILVFAPVGHPYAIGNGKGGDVYILEHRLVMEQHLGRYLDPAEVVHHIDGNPSNNAIENLRLCSSQSEHIKTEHPGPPR